MLLVEWKLEREKQQVHLNGPGLIEMDHLQKSKWDPSWSTVTEDRDLHGGYGNSSRGKQLRMFLLYFTRSRQSFLRYPQSPELPRCHTESKTSGWGWKGFWKNHPRTLLSFHKWGHWDSEREMDLPKASEPLMARGTKIWVPDLRFSVLYPDPLSHPIISTLWGLYCTWSFTKLCHHIHYPLNNLEVGGISIPITSGGNWGPGQWRPHDKSMSELGQKLSFHDSLPGLFLASSCPLILCLLWCHQASGGQALTVPNCLVRSTRDALQNEIWHIEKKQMIHWAPDKAAQNRSFPDIVAVWEELRVYSQEGLALNPSIKPLISWVVLCRLLSLSELSLSVQQES